VRLREKKAMMTTVRLLGATTLLLAGAVVHADPCKIVIESNDVMRFNMHEITVPRQCSEVEVTLKHTGRLSAGVMGHDWVLAKDSDMSAIVNTGLAAGLKHGFLPENDKRVIAATKIVGGGESDTIRFATSVLQPGVHYAFFCTSPGHSTVMRGKFLIGEAPIAKAP
jgi:azurin